MNAPVPKELVCTICCAAMVDRLYTCCKFAICYNCVEKMAYRCPQRCVLNSLRERQDEAENVQRATEDEVLLLFEVPARPSFMDPETFRNWVDILLSRWDIEGEVTSTPPALKVTTEYPPLSQIVVAMDFSPPIVCVEGAEGGRVKDQKGGAEKKGGGNQRLLCHCGRARRSVRAACTHTLCVDCANEGAEKKSKCHWCQSRLTKGSFTHINI